jgi:hypothetical protein
MLTITAQHLDMVRSLLPDEHLTLAEIATLAGVSRETVLAFMDGNVEPGYAVVAPSPPVTSLPQRIVTTPSWTDSTLRAWRSEPRRSSVGEPRSAGPVKVPATVDHCAPRRRRSRLRKPRYLPTRAEIRQACLRLHERGRPRAEDLERPAYELPVASAGLFDE